MNPLAQFVRQYDPSVPLERAVTIPSAWYTHPEIHELERRSVFARNWLMVGRLDQATSAGQFFTVDLAGEPIVVVRGHDGVLRAFYNVCRHHAAAVADKPEGKVNTLQCPYHGWTYALSGELKGITEFDGVCEFEKSQNGLIPIRVDTWENFVFVTLDESAPGLPEFLGSIADRVTPLQFRKLHFFERRSYTLNCNWKVFIDNYLDGGYHVPFAHKSLNSVLDFTKYRIESIERYCVQSSPLSTEGADATTASVRKGDMAYYFWLYPNFMVNWYDGVMDTNLALPLGVDRVLVLFDFYFADVSAARADHNRTSVDVADRVQGEDIGVCESVQRGLKSKAYDVGRLSVRREAGEHLFHRLLHADLSANLT